MFNGWSYFPEEKLQAVPTTDGRRAEGTGGLCLSLLVPKHAGQPPNHDREIYY